METSIGRAFQRSLSSRFWAVFVTVLVIAVDFLLSVKWKEPIPRIGISLIGIGLLYLLAGGDLRSLGLNLKPKQTLRYWLVSTLAAGVMVGTALLVYSGFQYLLGNTTPSPRHLDFTFEKIIHWIWYACILAPLIEEPIYRLIFASGLKAILPSWLVVVLGGIVFAALHFGYGNPGPDNAVAGFILTWAFLKSESIVLPAILHALGNLCVLIIWLIM